MSSMIGSRKQYEGENPDFMSEDWFKQTEKDRESPKKAPEEKKDEKQSEKKK